MYISELNQHEKDNDQDTCSLIITDKPVSFSAEKFMTKKDKLKIKTYAQIDAFDPLNKLAKTADFVADNGITITTCLMFVTHTALMFIMIHYNIRQLALFNMFSAVLYLINTLISITGRIAPSFITMFIEIPSCAFLSTYYLGWNSGFSQYLIAFIPAIIYFGDIMCKGLTKLISIPFTGIIMYLYIKIYIYSHDFKPLIPMKPILLYTLFIINAVFVAIFISVYCSVYVIMLNSNKQTLIEKNKQLKTEMLHDPLTKLLNRRGFLPIINNLIENNDLFSIAFCDIDNFKKINDTYGHDAGDEVLKHVTYIIRREAKNCAICRWGGEEIVILLRNHNLKAAVKKMEHIRKIVEKTPTEFYKHKIPATITIGIEEYKRQYRDADKVIKIADERMYYGKQNGKNRIVFK